MKKLKILTTIICFSLCLSSCVSSYLHNTIKAPSLDTNTVADISSDISPVHINVSATVKVDSHCHVLASGYYATNLIKTNSNYQEVGIGYHTKTPAKTYKGYYFTIGYGNHNGTVYQGLPLLGNRDGEVTCSYARLSFTLYNKSARRKTMRYYAALRTSLAYYLNYKEVYKWNEFAFLGPASSSGNFKSSNFTQVVFEPVLGMEKMLGKKGIYIYGQSSLTLNLLAETAELDGHTFSFPQHTLLSMRFGVGYIWQKPDRKTISKG